MPKERLSVVVTRRLPDEVETRLSELFDVRLRNDDTPMSRAQIVEAMKAADVLVPTITDTVDAAMIGQAGDRLKLIANYGAGVDNIDVATARQRGILVSNTPGVLTDDTADMTMALILAVTRRIPEGLAAMQGENWSGWAPTAFLGGRVAGRRLGILGMGRIGQAVARRCHYGFEMPVLYYNRSRKAVDLPAQQVDSLGDLMAQSDIVVVTVPGGGANTHLIDATALAAMKPTGIFVNIARGDVVDEDALIAALQSGQIAGAGLDVFAQEPIVPDAFRAMENVVLLPHLGTAALEVREAMGLMAVDNLRAHFAGKPLPNAV